MDIWTEILGMAVSNGLWAVLFCALLFHQIKDGRKRETKYQATIDTLGEGLKSVRVNQAKIDGLNDGVRALKDEVDDGVKVLKEELDEVKDEVHEVKGEVIVVKGEICGARQELKKEIGGIKTALIKAFPAMDTPTKGKRQKEAV